MRRLTILAAAVLVAGCYGAPAGSTLPSGDASATPFGPEMSTLVPSVVPSASPSTPATSSPLPSRAAACGFPTTVLALTGHDPAWPGTSMSTILECLGHSEIRVTGWLAEACCLGWGSPGVEPAWLGDMLAIGRVLWLKPMVGEGCYADTSCVWMTLTSPNASELPLSPERWVTITGHFDDPAAATCYWTGLQGGYSVPLTKGEAVASCRSHFVVTAIEDATSPIGPTVAGCPGASVVSGGLPLLKLASVTVDVLNVRTGPCAAASIESGDVLWATGRVSALSPLRQGALVLVLGSPVASDGYRWYPVGFDLGRGTTGLPAGWVAAGTGSDTWLRPTQPTCGAPTFDGIAALSPVERVACYGSSSISFVARQASTPVEAGLGGVCNPDPGQPRWLVCDNIDYNIVNADGGPLGSSQHVLSLFFDPARGIEPLGLAPVGTIGPAYQIRGHFEDEAAKLCTSGASPGYPAWFERWARCATEFVVEELRVAA
jgi:hypothetical protein